VCLAVASILLANEPSAAQLYREGRKAERAGDVVRAYLLYSEAAARDPKNPKYWAHSQALRTQAVLKAKPLPKADDKDTSSSSGTTPAAEAAPKPQAGFSTTIEDADLFDLQRLKGPPELKPLAVRKNLDLRGNARDVVEQVARAFGLDTVFDGDYQPGPQMRLQLDDVDCREALHAAEAATNSFVFPLDERLLMVVKDTPQKRAEQEPAIAVTIPIPESVSVQDAQALARGVQQTMDIVKLAVDANRRMVLIKDRISKVRPAQELFEQLAHGPAQVMIEMQFLEVDRTNMLSYGFLMPSKFPILYFGGGVPGVTQSLARFLMGHITLGLGIADAQLFATMNRSLSKTLYQSQMRSLDGQVATFHVGQKYPVLTGGFLGPSTYGGLPSFNFEDLGLVLKVTPHVHGMDEVSLEVDAEFKVLSGQSENGIPVISSRKLQSKVRVKEGEWGVISGLMTMSEALTISGVPGISTLPAIGRALRQTNRDVENTEVLVLMRPLLVDVPPDQFLTRTFWVGSEARLQIPR
jgi:general secretion pathway protein D